MQDEKDINSSIAKDPAFSSTAARDVSDGTGLEIPGIPSVKGSNFDAFGGVSTGNQPMDANANARAGQASSIASGVEPVSSAKESGSPSRVPGAEFSSQAIGSELPVQTSSAKTEGSGIGQSVPANAEGGSMASSETGASVASSPKGHSGPKHGAHAKKAQSTFMQRSSRMRKVLIAAIVVLVILVVAIVFFAIQAVQTADDSATQQAQVADTEVTHVDDSEDASDGQEKVTTVPNLVSLLGHTRNEAIKMLAHGAEVKSSRKVNEKGSFIRREVQVELTDEPSDSVTGTPTVYLSLDEDGKIIQDGYSVSTSSLGYGSVSFGDAIEHDGIIENTLGEAGLTVESGTVSLPEDKSVYSTYSSDGKTLTKENCSFSGTGTADGVKYDWEAILAYDYTVANTTDNLSDTIRTIYIYITKA